MRELLGSVVSRLMEFFPKFEGGKQVGSEAEVGSEAKVGISIK